MNVCAPECGHSPSCDVVAQGQICSVTGWFLPLPTCQEEPSLKEVMSVHKCVCQALKWSVPLSC